MLLNRRGLLVLAAFVAALLFCLSAKARDLGQWQYASPNMAEYFATLLQPDTHISCCGEADVYWADKTEACHPSDQPCGVVAIITDTRDDLPLGRQHVPLGTRIVIPPNKIRRPPSPNPTEHNLVFLGMSGSPYCWEPLPQF